MHLTIILHFDASKITDPALAKSQYLAIQEFCKNQKYNLLAREEAYHEPEWSWFYQTLKLTYDYLWGDFGAEENKIDGVVTIGLDVDLKELQEKIETKSCIWFRNAEDKALLEKHVANTEVV